MSTVGRGQRVPWSALLNRSVRRGVVRRVVGGLRSPGAWVCVKAGLKVHANLVELGISFKRQPKC